MKVSELSAAIMIIVGGIFLLAGIVQGRKIWRQIPPELQGRWRLITNLMVFFLLGYLLFLVILISHFRFPLELVTGPVFLSGALFVFVVINLSKETISRAKSAENELRNLNETLELRVAERTRQLLESEAELKESYEELQNFAYIVSHDMRAPLVNIKGFSHELTDLLREVEVRMEGAVSQLGESQRDRIAAIFRNEIPEALDFIGTSVSRMDAMIGAILKLSRLGRREITSEPISLAQLVNRVLKSMTHQLESSRAIVTVGELPELLTDRTALEQIIGNLLDNAVKYLEPDRPGRIEINAEWDRTEATVHIRDNGRGIAADEMHKVFEIFCRAGRRDTPGEGMGLAYVKALLKNLNGRIWCESEPGVGTTFSFAVPIGLQGEMVSNTCADSSFEE